MSLVTTKDFISDREEIAMSGNHKGGFGEPMSGFDSEGNSLTVSFGWGTREGETFLADGTDQSSRDFMQHDNHNHYGSGNGPNDNVKDRGMYSGPGA